MFWKKKMFTAQVSFCAFQEMQPVVVTHPADTELFCLGCQNNDFKDTKTLQSCIVG